MRLSLFNRHTLSVLCAGLFLCGSLLSAPKAQATAALTRTYSATTNSASIGTIKQIRYFPDGMLVLGTSRTVMEKFSSDGSSVTDITLITSLPCTTVNSFVGTGSIANGFLYFTCSGNATVPKYTITDSYIDLFATGTASTTGASDINIQPDGKILVSKIATIFTFDKSMVRLQTSTGSAAMARFAPDASRNIYYVTAGRVLRKFNLDSLVDVIIHTAFTGTGVKGLYTTHNGTTYYADTTGGIIKTSASGTILWTQSFSNLASIDLDPSGNLYAINTSGTVSVYAPIGAPSSLTATATGSGIRLNWVTGVGDMDFSGATLLRSTTSYPTSPTDGVVVARNNIGTTLLDTGLSDNTTYYYTIFNQTSEGYYGAGTIASATTDFAPGPVTGLTAVASGNDITLDWTNPADADYSSIMIRRSTVGPITGTGAGSIIAPEMDIHHYVDSDREDGTYYYGIFAKDSGGHYSTVATASATIDTVGPNVPTLVATVVGSTVQLSWDTPATTSYYMIRRSASSYPASGSDGSLVLITSADVTSTADFSLADGTYYYSIFAYDDLGNASTAGHATATIATASSSSSSSSASSAAPSPSVSHGGGRGSRGTTGPRTAIVSTHPAAIVTTPAKPPMSVEVRTCQRVQKQFFGESLKRVNERLQKRLGFACH